jgi:lysophospholipase L1-like esterase
MVAGIRAGGHNVALRSTSLPAFYEPAAEFPIQVPETTEAFYPVALPIGNNNPNLYLGFGDSITFGQGSSDGRGYGPALHSLLAPHLGRAEVRLWGRSADTSLESTEVAKKTVRDVAPAYTLILFGTNDWHDQSCQGQPPSACFTIEALRSIVLEVKTWRSLPVLGTVPPVNPALAPAGRNEWVDELNVSIAALAREQGALLADINAAFKAQGDLSSLFDDDVHPNDAGYEVLAQAWFEAITRARSASASSRRRGFGFSFGG